MVNEQIGLLVATLAIVASACSSGGATTAPAKCSAGGQRGPGQRGPGRQRVQNGRRPVRLHGRRVVEQLPAATLGRPRSASIKETVEAGGGSYISKDANLSTEQQLTDVDTLLSQGANVLIILAQDPTAIGPAVEKAKAAGVPVIGYDRLIEDPEVLYVTFDNIGVGTLEAEADHGEGPRGQLRPDQGPPGRPECHDVPARRAGTPPA